MKAPQIDVIGINVSCSSSKWKKSKFLTEYKHTDFVIFNLEFSFQFSATLQVLQKCN